MDCEASTLLFTALSSGQGLDYWYMVIWYKNGFLVFLQTLIRKETMLVSSLYYRILSLPVVMNGDSRELLMLNCSVNVNNV